MSMTDPIADMLTRVRNAIRVRKAASSWARALGPRPCQA